MAGPDSKTGLIEVRLRAVAQLFNSLDPSPFLERDLDDDAEAYIVNWAREFDTDQPIELIVHLPPQEVEKAQQRDLAAALANYFAYRAVTVHGDLKELIREGQRFLAIGFSLLTVCLLASRMVEPLLGTGPFAKLVSESLIIVGWVANWRPIETFLYDWWPIKRKRDLYRRLARAEIRVVETP